MPQYHSDLFTKNTAHAARSLRNTSADLRLPLKGSTNGQKWFSFRGSKSWNSLTAQFILAS